MLAAGGRGGSGGSGVPPPAAAMKSPQAQRPAGQAPGEDGGGGLAEALGEFDAVLAEFSCPAGRRRFHYGEHLERMKRRSSASVSDGSGLSDSEIVNISQDEVYGSQYEITFSGFNTLQGQRSVLSTADRRSMERKPQKESKVTASSGADSLYRNSFSLSDEKLNSPTASIPSLPSPSVTPCKAKLGDTKELEDFIAHLDRTLASM